MCDLLFNCYGIFPQVFLRESEKMHLDSTLHTAIMQRVITIQRWVKTTLERQGFLRLREAAVVIQVRRWSIQTVGNYVCCKLVLERKFVFTRVKTTDGWQ